MDNILSSYQKKIGSYDKQKWEQTIDERMLKGLSGMSGVNAIPKKVAKVKTELIDLDLIRGTAFTKAKSQQGWLSATFSGINRVILLPLYLKWWREQTNAFICLLLLALYVLQVISLRIYFEDGLSSTSDQFSEVPASEVLMPIVMMTILGVIHTQIVGTKLVNKTQSSFHPSKYATNSQNLQKKKRKRKPKQSPDKGTEKSETRTVKTGGSDDESGLGSLDIKEDVVSNKPLGERRGLSSIERLNFETTIPSIQITERISVENSDLSSDEFDLEDSSCNQYFWRRFSDSKSFKSKRKLNNMNELEVTSRRYSEGSKDAKNNKYRDTLRSKKRKRIKSLHLSPPVNHHKHKDYSSCESEGTLSPTTPNTPTPGMGMASDLDWPLINSEGTSDEDDSHQETTTSTAAKYFIYPEFGEEVSAPLYTIFNELCHDSHDDNTNETKVSCAVWQQHECQKVDLSVADISSSIIRKVDSIKHSSEYIYLGFVFSIILAILPGLFRVQQNGNSASAQTNTSEIIDLLNFPTLDLYFIGEYRAKRSEVPHFRLHKVRNLKAWLSVRSYLRRHGPIRSVDAICSSSFVIAVCILTFICLQLLKESEMCAAKLYCWEMVFWNLALGLYIMRLMILGSRINRKYRENLSILITEQINLYLQLEQKPHKKEELTLANHVLKLAADLLKELESPYKISGFCANPYLYNITKVVVFRRKRRQECLNNPKFNFEIF
ncbi:unnamed protein product [Medioppia subpectinata]|uniref:PHTF1/2 N-terminal domain-containing protein n=1 Tax=Medioppia subpectinata TaxID=1979941 RepID=A0A7R9PVD2_9ACAR|nr:unnamed protein product [Medioppia subpectinata]CAG2102703.1 unnamed protein product [Medioppia subpectinata]